MKVGPIMLIPYTGGFNVRHQKPEPTVDSGDNVALTGGIEDGEFPASTLVIHKRSNVMDVWA